MRRSGINIMYKLIGLVKPLAHIMILAILTGVLGYLTAIFITIFGGFAILKTLNFDINMSTKFIFIAVVIFGILRGVLRYIEQLSNHYIAFKLLAIIRNKVFTALRRLSPAKLEGRDKGNLISIITSDIELLEVFYAHTISPIAIGFLTSLTMVIFIGSYHYVLAIFAVLAYITVGILIPIGVSKIGNEVGLNYRNEFGHMNSFILDSLRGLKEVIQYKMGNEKLREINRRTESLGSKHKSLKDYEGIAKSITDTIILLFSVSMLFLSINLESRGLIGFDGVLIATISMMSSFGPVVALSSLSNNLRHTLASGNRVFDLLEEEPAVEEVLDGEDIAFSGIGCQNIDFAYDKEQILENYSLDIKKNTIIGIHGKSGSGKSTLLKLLMRFWDVDKGKVLISGRNIKDVNTSSLREIESYVTQETYIFNDTIGNNIRIGKKYASFEEVVEAAKKASIHEFIKSLPKGYETNAGEMGDSLSSGEKQRIGLARAFLHDAPFILLDEPTSNLDTLNEGIILKSLAEESKDKTMIVVSHRRSTMNIADTIYHMESARSS